jgi:hypothetical protein
VNSRSHSSGVNLCVWRMGESCATCRISSE